jgi:hypothetical protein
MTVTKNAKRPRTQRIPIPDSFIILSMVGA